MTTTDPAHVATLTTKPQARKASRTRPGDIALAVLMPLAPACVAALRGLLPYFHAGNGTEAVRDVAAHPTAQSAVVWLGFVAVLTFPVAAIRAASVVRDAAPRLTVVAEALLVPGYLALSMLVAEDVFLSYGASHPAAAKVVAGLYDHPHPAVIAGTAVFVIGHVLGTVLLGIAVVRAHVLPLWAGVALIICQPLHFTALVILGYQPLDVVAWSLNAVVFGMLAVVWLRRR